MNSVESQNDVVHDGDVNIGEGQNDDNVHNGLD